MMEGIFWVPSPEFWREIATVRFWITLAALVLGSLAAFRIAAPWCQTFWA